jgi:hypothetical protein
VNTPRAILLASALITFAVLANVGYSIHHDRQEDARRLQEQEQVLQRQRRLLAPKLWQAALKYLCHSARLRAIVENSFDSSRRFPVRVKEFKDVKWLKTNLVEMSVLLGVTGPSVLDKARDLRLV